MLRPTSSFRFTRFTMAVAGLATLTAVLPAQSDRTVTTTRVGDRGPVLPEGAVVAPQPRYYLDTVDNLTRFTDDATRPAPGLSKNNYISKSFPIYNCDAIEIQAYLLRMLAYEGGVCEVMSQPDVTDAAGLKVQFLFVAAPEHMIPDIAEMVKMCDRPGFKFADGTATTQYVGKNRTASELKAILSGTEIGNVGGFLFPPFADDSINSIYIVDNPTDMPANLDALAMFDKPPLQLELTVSIYEIEDGNMGKLGLDWDAWKRFASGSFDYTSISDVNFFEENGDTMSTLLSLDARAVGEFLNYTSQTGTSKVLTSTKLTMVNSEDIPGGLSGGARGASTGVPAVIESITTIPYTVLQNDIGGTTSSNGLNELLPLGDRGAVVPYGTTTVSTDAFEGVRVTILPFIGVETTTLSITTQVNSLVGYSKGADIPIISSRSLTTVANVKDGSALVLGGLDKTNTTTSTVGIPGLKDLPVLKYIFGKESSNKSTSKVLISVVPKIKGADGDSPSDAMISGF